MAADFGSVLPACDQGEVVLIRLNVMITGGKEALFFTGKNR